MVRRLLACGTLLSFSRMSAAFLLPPGLEGQRAVVSHLLLFASMMAREIGCSTSSAGTVAGGAVRVDTVGVAGVFQSFARQPCRPAIRREFYISAILEDELESVNICPPPQSAS